MNCALKRMAKGGKTFYFAAKWLNPQQRNDAATAYSFCRLVDDLADNLPPSTQRLAQLNQLRDALIKANSDCPEALGMLNLIARYPQIAAPATLLVESCTEDLPGIRIKDGDELIRYAHGVAGTVGLMMYPILGGRDPEGLAYAADLGIAMQLTNIARDIVSDLRNDRVYLPSEWLDGHTLSGLLSNDPKVERSVVAATKRLLDLSDHYYRRGISGLPYLESRSRFAIEVAAACYAAIGKRVIKNERIARHRVVVPLHTKILIAIGVSRARLKPSLSQTTHQPLAKGLSR